VAQADRDAGVRHDGLTSRATGTDAIASREPATEDGARHTLSRGRLVCPGDRRRTTEGYGFMRRTGPGGPLLRWRGCWRSPPVATTRG
jgi:hypothetical protein